MIQRDRSERKGVYLPEDPELVKEILRGVKRESRALWLDVLFYVGLVLEAVGIELGIIYRYPGVLFFLGLIIMSLSNSLSSRRTRKILKIRYGKPSGM